MPTRVRSIWQRAPEPIPPPVVCRTEPIPLVQDKGIFDLKYIGQIQNPTTPPRIITSLSIIVSSLPGSTAACGDMLSNFWVPDGGEPGEPINLIGAETPVPIAPIGDITFCYGITRLVNFATITYDEVIKITFTEPGRVLYNLYIDLGRMSRKESPNHG